jgi:site-specific DNA-cytosine methylase
MNGIHGPYTFIERAPVFYSGFDTPVSLTASALRKSDAHKNEMGVILDERLRRFTPLERERLQGFPDGWTAIPWGRGKNDPELCPEGPRAAALGNSMPVPVMAWIGERIAADAARAELRDAA